MQSKSAIASLYLAISILAFTGYLSRVLPLDAMSITVLRSAVATVGFLIFVSVQGASLRLRDKRDIPGVVALGILMGLHWTCFFHAMQVSSIAVGMLSFYTYPLMTVFIEPLFSKRSLQLRDVIAGLCVLVGVLVMVWDSNGFERESSVATGTYWGLAAALLMAVRNLIAKYHLHDVDAKTLMFYQVLLIALIGSTFIDFHELSGIGSRDWLRLILLGLVITAGGHTLIIASLKHLPAKTVAMISCIQPVIAIVIGWVLLREGASLQVLVGGAIVLAVALYESWQPSRN